MQNQVDLTAGNMGFAAMLAGRKNHQLFVRYQQQFRLDVH